MLKPIAITAAAFVIFQSAAQDFNNDGHPDLLWRHRQTGENIVWILDGLSHTRSVILPSEPDAGWRIAGTGDFNGDNRIDLLWEHERWGLVGFWFMSGADGSRRDAGAMLTPAAEAGVHPRAAADFNNDGKADVVWENAETGVKGIWIMNGAQRTDSITIDQTSGADWTVVGAGNLANGATPDIILRHRTSGEINVWVMHGTEVFSGASLTSGEVVLRERDLDWEIVSVADFNSDDKPDLFWRHSTLGLNRYWLLDGTSLAGSDFAKHEFDIDWRLASQHWPPSRWRIDYPLGLHISARDSSDPPGLHLRFHIPALDGWEFTVQRRRPGSETWNPIVTGLTAPVDTYTDEEVALGDRFEYRVFVERPSPSVKLYILGGVHARPIEDRGRVILLVDETLAPSIADSLESFTEDLIGDGWEVLRHDVPRHIDDYSGPESFWPNAQNLTNEIRPLIRADYEADPERTKGVILIGHVPVPYSGDSGLDNHTRLNPPDHQGAWPTDLIYGDIDGVWTDTQVNYINNSFPENTNIPNDGKFDQNFVVSDLELFVGRIDFARMPVFTSEDPAQSEAGLIRQYLAKNHRYRHNLPPYPLRGRSALFTSFANGIPNLAPNVQVVANAVRNTAALYPNGLEQIIAINPFRQTQRSYFWGFSVGPGDSEAIHIGIPFLTFSSAEFKSAATEPRVGIHLLFGSFFGDWNMRNNLLRAALAGPNYGLASAWSHTTQWLFYPLGLGEPLGSALVATANNKDFPQNRVLNIMGDPTLRLHVVSPPADLRANNDGPGVELTWTSREPGAEYYVFRAPRLDGGAFTRITPNAVGRTSFTDPDPPSGDLVYMVRTLKRVETGSGSYTNLSQGAFIKLQQTRTPAPLP